MPPEFPDFTVAERTFERRLRAWGLSPRPLPQGVATGYDRLELYRSETEVATLDLKDQPKTYFASLEVKAVLEHPALGKAEILDLVTLDGDSPTGAVERCANTYMDVTFPALRSLFEGAPAPGAQTIKLTSYTPALGKAIQWEVYSGQLQTLNDPEGRLARRLHGQPPVVLMFNTLTGHLAEPRLHWCKLFGANQALAGLTFGCSIDGRKSAEAEAEMADKFHQGGELPGSWEFRQFLVLRPGGEADAATTAELRQKAAEMLPRPRPKRGWWSWLTGR